MTKVLLTGIGVGAVAALLVVSVASGIALSLILFCLAPLPIMIVALGWSHWAGLVAAVAAATMLGGALGISVFANFLTSIGAPAWWLGYLALLGRPVANGGDAQVEWYPAGRLVLWAVLFGAAVTAGTLATFGSDEAAIMRGLGDALQQVLQPQTGAPAEADAPRQVPSTPVPGAQVAGAGDTDPMVNLQALVRILPPVAAVIATLTQILNLWLAGQVVRMSGRLRRPWPDLTALSFPPPAAVLYGAFLAGALLPGLPGLAAGLLAAPLSTAFAMVGLAVMHTATRGMRGRAAVLWGAYGCVFFLLWPVVVMTIIGVAETLFGLRGRFSRRSPPAAHNP
jgi:hypothetical protein